MFTTFAVLSTLTLSGTQAYADDGNPSAPPDSLTTSPPPTVDPTSPGLKLADGATLAPAKVLDIKSVVEDLGGE
ncbi:OmpA family protein, partial [Streptomyces sp. NPDC057927]